MINSFKQLIDENVIEKYNSSFNNHNDIFVEKINNSKISTCISNMNNGKAAGPDGIVVEHIRMAEHVIIDFL